MNTTHDINGAGTPHRRPRNFGGSDLPLNADAATRFLPWVIAFTTFLAGLALLIALLVNDASARWRQGLSGTMTVQILPVTESKSAPPVAERTEAALRLLRRTPGIASASTVPVETTKELVRPWLGGDILAHELPLPVLIDIRLETGAAVDTDALSAQLENAVKGARLDDHRDWLQRLIGLATALEWLMIAVVAVVGFVVVATIVYTTRAGLAIHREIIEVLHLLGAPDFYIARQFQYRALRLGLQGGFIGGLGAAAAAWVIVLAAGRIDVTLIPALIPNYRDGLVLITLPVLTGLIAMFTARLTVFRTLARMV